MIPYPTVPQTITVHLGAPQEGGLNVSVPFADYIKNVASSEIYPTWPGAAIRANVLAQISVALNRVYTEYYRSRGFDFDITSSSAYDQMFVYQRDIYENISEIVDDLFTTYIRRDGNVEPLFATFCDGEKVRCDGLSQWGSVTLARDGNDDLQILKQYYGDNIELVYNAPVRDQIASAPPVALREGDTGSDVEILQRRLNRISKNFPGIPKIHPADGLFDQSTTDAVRVFQTAFGLRVDGIVGKSTWYRIQEVYFAVKRLAEVTSEGLTIADLSTQYPSVLREGISSAGVMVLQYYLGYISLFVPSVLAPALDGSFGQETKNSVISFQKTYRLQQDGIVDRAVWNKIQSTYYDYVDSVEYRFKEGAPLPFPGRILRVGVSGDDVRVLQEYLNRIAAVYTDIPTLALDGIFGAKTAAAVDAFERTFGLADTQGRVSAVVWNAIASVYEDLYSGSQVNPGQYPGYVIE